MELYTHRERRLIFLQGSPESAPAPESKEKTEKQGETPATLLAKYQERAGKLIENLRQFYSEEGDPLDDEARAIQDALNELLKPRAEEIADLYLEIDNDIQMLTQMIESAESRLKEKKNPRNLTEHVLPLEYSESYKLLHEFSIPVEEGKHAPFSIDVSYPETRLVPERVLRPARIFRGRLCGQKEWVTCGYREVTETVHKRYQIEPDAFRNTPQNSLRIDPIGQIRLRGIADGQAQYSIGVRKSFEGSFALSGEGFNYSLNSGRNEEYRPREAAEPIDAAALAAEMKEEAFLTKAAVLRKESEELKNAHLTAGADPEARLAAAKVYFSALDREAGFWRDEREDGMLEEAFEIAKNRLISEGLPTRDLIRQLERDKGQEQRIGAVEKENIRQDTEIGDLKEEDRKLNAAIVELRKQDKNLADRIEELVLKDARFARQIARLADRDTDLANRIAELSRTDENLAKRIVALEEQKDEMRRQIEELEKRVRDAEDDALLEMKIREREFLREMEAALLEEAAKIVPANVPIEQGETMDQEPHAIVPPEPVVMPTRADIPRARPAADIAPEVRSDRAPRQRTVTPELPPITTSVIDSILGPDTIETEAELRPKPSDIRTILSSDEWKTIQALDLWEAMANPDGENGVALRTNLDALNITRFDSKGRQEVLDELNKKIRDQEVLLNEQASGRITLNPL